MRLSFLLYVLLAFTSYAEAVSYFSNPIKLSNGSDPFMVFYNGYYYLLTTTWSNIQITRATTIAGLKTATPKVIWTDTTTNRCCSMWAPELHRINGRWYIYYTAGPSGGDNQRLWVIQGPTGNPLDSSYSFLSRMVPPNNDIQMLDGSVFPMSNGKNYFLYSAWGSDGQTIWISELLTPGTIGPSTKISVPTYSWEKNGYSVNEGPIGLSHNGRDFIFFSASLCSTQYYALGYIALTPGANPLVASSWTKKSTPAFSSANEDYGPAHNGFFKSPDGTEDWIVYHANSSPSGTCDGGRQTYVQKILWNSDGTPNLLQPVARGTILTPPSGEEGNPTSSPTSTAASSGATQALYGQCGGSGWTGPTLCPTGSSCVYSNEWYSQCV